MSADLHCPKCGLMLDMAQLLGSREDSAAFEHLLSISIPIANRVLLYIDLHTPPVHRLSIAKRMKLIRQLLPDLSRQAITRAGRDWSTPHAVWAQGIDQMLATRDAGRLDLPLKGHGYLYAVLQGLADKAEASAEQQAEAQRRTGSTTNHTVTVRGQPMGIGAALATVYGGQDPTLAALDERDRKAAPMPEAVRQKWSEMGSKRSAAATTEQPTNTRDQK